VEFKTSTKTKTEDKKKQKQHENPDVDTNSKIESDTSSKEGTAKKIEFVSRRETKKELIREIVIILDESGSMLNWGDGVVNGYKKFLDMQENSKKITYITLILFNDDVRQVITRKSIEEAKNISYNPEGCTSLYDAIALAIRNVSETQMNLNTFDKAGEVVFAIITDGEDNVSKIPPEVLKELIEIKKKINNWKFVFLGASKEVCKQGEILGIDASLNFDFGEKYEENGQKIFGLLGQVLLQDEELTKEAKKEYTPKTR
jgi:Mg-chelatase subunit ChlD